MTTKTQELRKDVDELEKLEAIATRKCVQDLLSTQIARINTQLHQLNIEADGVQIPKEKTEIASALKKSYTVTIRNYSWDESDKFMKLYVTLKNVQTINKENVTCTFTSSGFSLLVSDLEGKCHELSIDKLAGVVVPSSSFTKIKTDMVLIMVAKESTSKWEAVTASEAKVKESRKPKMDKADPSGGMMDIMKQMYDDGDDNMKRMLNKTWYESQQKNLAGGGGGDPMAGMAGMAGMGGMGMGGMGGMDL